MAEQVSEQVFQAFKEEVLRGFDNITKSISELVGEIRVYSSNVQNQAEKIAVHENQLKEMEKLKLTVEEQGKEITELRTEHKISQRNLITVFSAISIIIGIISICVAIFK